jgi:hypothetical protein
VPKCPPRQNKEFLLREQAGLRPRDLIQAATANCAQLFDQAKPNAAVSGVSGGTLLWAEAPLALILILICASWPHPTQPPRSCYTRAPGRHRLH